MPDQQAGSHAWKPLVVCPHGEMARKIQGSLGELGLGGFREAVEYPRMGTLAGVAAQSGANICFLDVASNQEHGLMLISEAAPVFPVVALNPRNDADLILRCLRRGACEFLSDPTPEQVRGVLERLAHVRAPAEPGKSAIVYCVVPGKPGCGASTLAAHLALELERGAGAKVLLIDADWLTASVAFLLKLKSEFHLGEVLRDCQRLDEDLWHRLAAHYHGIDVVPAPGNAALRVEIEPEAAATLLQFVRRQYDAVVIDLGGVEAAASVAGLGDELLLVTTNELAALHATKRSLEYLERNGVELGRIKLLVTRYTPAVGLKRDDLETALKLAPFAVLNNDYEAVQNALLEGKPVPAGSAFGRSIQALGARLTGKEKVSAKRAGWFGRRVSRA